MELAIRMKSITRLNKCLFLKMEELKKQSLRLIYLLISLSILCHSEARRSSRGSGSKKIKALTHFSSYRYSYNYYSPDSLPPYDEVMGPSSPPETNLPYCFNPPISPIPPPSTFATPPPPELIYGAPPGIVPNPPLYPPIPPITIPSPPEYVPTPPVTIPNPPEIIPNPPVIFPNPPGNVPNPPEIIPNPPGYVPIPPVTLPSPPEYIPTPPETVPSPPEYIPTPPETVPSPPEFTPTPPVTEPSPPEYIPPVTMPSPPEYTPTPPITTPSPPAYIPNPPVTVPSPPEYVPGPPFYLPPVVYPPPTVPPPPARGTGPPLWCVARPTVPDPILLEAMNYACGSGADCDAIQPNGACFEPDTLISHASYAFNSFWQRTKGAGSSCDFGGTAMLITKNPSFDGCHFVLN
ncbi:Glucan endo-1,3-beta-D-glucosidase protein [Dioscorea alata]|uniref:Glucan endo-1,3-beta-D-glucosidase protein n=1 Tax=Dioscorea alata TaxID=55571 RepID=A0ACB7VN80_DIOAL|nr:Glucan endo-1,3-beta-D-glucosidase protein [Dioscorea alata]